MSLVECIACARELDWAAPIALKQLGGGWPSPPRACRPPVALHRLLLFKSPELLSVDPPPTYHGRDLEPGPGLSGDRRHVEAAARDRGDEAYHRIGAPVVVARDHE